MTEKKKKKIVRKKAAVKKAPELVPEEGTNEPKEGLKLTGEEMARLDAFEARVTTQGVVLENLTLRQDALTAEYRNQMAQLKARKRATQDSMLKIKDEHNAFISKLETRLEVSLKDYSIEPDGELVFNPLPEEQPGE